MEVPLIPFFRRSLPRAAATLVRRLPGRLLRDLDRHASGGKRQDRRRRRSDVNIERVVLQAYRAIGDRHLYEPNFRTLSAEAYRGFASADPSLSLATSDGAFTVKRDGRDVLTRPAPADTYRRAGLGGMLAELMAGSMDASPVAATDRPSGP